MKRVTYDYYKSVFGGEISEEEFASHVRAARDAICDVVNRSVRSVNASPEDGTDGEIARAICLEIDYLAKMKKSASPDGRGAVRESLGDYSVTYGSAGGVMRTFGVPVSPEAVLCLRRAGLFSRWV